MIITSLELRSEVTPAGQLRLSLEVREVAPAGPDEVVVRVEAAPINPADLAELLGSADVSTLRREATTDRPVTTAELPSRLVPLAAGRVGKSLAVGLEGAGVGGSGSHLASPHPCGTTRPGTCCLGVSSSSRAMPVI
jgi:NADPH2:quinone reductase